MDVLILVMINFNTINKTRMTTYIKTKFKKSVDQTYIDKYRVVANITEYYIISKLIFLITKFMKKNDYFKNIKN